MSQHLAKKIRVYELARELGLTNKEALDLCLALGIGVKSHSSSIEDQQADRVRRKADREGFRRDVQPEDPAEPVKGKSGRATKAGAELDADADGAAVARAPDIVLDGPDVVAIRPAPEVPLAEPALEPVE